jgi:tRNA splicing endonuclease
MRISARLIGDLVAVNNPDDVNRLRREHRMGFSRNCPGSVAILLPEEVHSLIASDKIDLIGTVSTTCSVRCAVFDRIYRERAWYITSAFRYGGDFLLYVAYE